MKPVHEGLAATDAPVARIVRYDGDDPIGIPCCVMETVSGHIIRRELPDGFVSTCAEREQLAFVFVDTLGAHYAVEPDVAGLDDYGQPAGFMARHTVHDRLER